MDTAPPTSENLTQAIRAEQRELALRIAELRTSREALLSELATIERGLAEIAERNVLLDRLAAVGYGKPSSPQSGSASGASTQISLGPKRSIRGPQIRRAAVSVLLEDPLSARSGIHYKAWYERLVEAGFQVRGKDPVAVFLTQLTRCPAIRKAELPGTYRVDLDSPTRLRDELDRLERALREISTVTTTRPDEIRHIRARRSELTIQIQQTEKSLEEVLDVLGPSPE